MSYTQAQLTQLRDMIAKGVTSIEQNGEKVTFRSLPEMITLERIMSDALGQSTPNSGGIYAPSFTRGRR